MKASVSPGRRLAARTPPNGRPCRHSQECLAGESDVESEAKQVVFDLETGGLETHRPIIQIAAIAVDEDFNELEVFEAKIRFDEAKACPDALRRIHYIRAEWKRSAVAPKTAAWAFARFLRRHATVEVVRRDLSVFRVAQLVSHNSQFDGPFLTAWYERLGIFLPASYWLFHENPHLPLPDDFRLGTLCQYFDVPLDPGDAHEALADARATIGLLKAMTHVGTSPTTNGSRCPLR